jgi:hypothetical protein
MSESDKTELKNIPTGLYKKMRYSAHILDCGKLWVKMVEAYHLTTRS